MTMYEWKTEETPQFRLWREVVITCLERGDSVQEAVENADYILSSINKSFKQS